MKKYISLFLLVVFSFSTFYFKAGANPEAFKKNASLDSFYSHSVFANFLSKLSNKQTKSASELVKKKTKPKKPRKSAYFLSAPLPRPMLPAGHATYASDKQHFYLTQKPLTDSSRAPPAV